jgi:hypothetical protein
VTATANRVPHIVGNATLRKVFASSTLTNSHLAPSNPWQLRAFGRHFQDHFPLQCLSERRIEHPMSPLGRSWRKTAI